MSGPTAPWNADHLQLELLDPGSVELLRLFKYPKADWEPPAPQYRNLRVDPPPGHESEFAVLYTGDTIEAVAMECRILRFDSDRDEATWNRDRAKPYLVARYRFTRPALFIPLDHNRKVLELRRIAFSGYRAHQELSLELFKRYGDLAHGLSWESYHRGQPGRVYAVWHHRKDQMGLTLESTGKPFVDDAAWLKFLAEHSDIEAVESPPPAATSASASATAPPAAATVPVDPKPPRPRSLKRIR